MHSARQNRLRRTARTRRIQLGRHRLHLMATALHPKMTVLTRRSQATILTHHLKVTIPIHHLGQANTLHLLLLIMESIPLHHRTMEITLLLIMKTAHMDRQVTIVTDDHPSSNALGITASAY
jgi:hypothetical protein